MTKRRWSIKVGTLVVGSIVLIWAVAVVGIVVLATGTMRAYALEEAESKARLILDRNLATHTYITHDLKPPLFELIDRLNMPADYFEPTWMSSTYAVRRIDDHFQELIEEPYYYKEAAVNARTPANEADAFERAFIEALNEDPALTSQALIREMDGEPYFVTIRRGEQMGEDCLRCHDTPERAPSDLLALYGSERSFSREAGDVVSAISIRVPLADAYASVRTFSLRLLAALLALLGSLLLVQMLFYRRMILKPLRAMRDTALLIATHEERVGDHVPVPFGTEFAELAAAFNSMSDALRLERNRLVARNKELRELSLLKDEFVSSISHDLRTPVTNLKLYHHLMTVRPEKAERYKETIDRETRRLEYIVEELLSVSQIERLPQKLETAPLDLALVVRRYVADYTPLVESRGLSIDFHESPGLPPVQGDLVLLERVLHALVQNALSYTPEAGQIRVSVGVEKQDGEPWVYVRVANSGPGIPPDELPHVFDRFFRGKIALEHGVPGAGLGLAIAKDIVKRHGGRITVQQNGDEEQGATFTVWLPASGE